MRKIDTVEHADGRREIIILLLLGRNGENADC
jgi:hypothetical protein